MHWFSRDGLGGLWVWREREVGATCAWSKGSSSASSVSQLLGIEIDHLCAEDRVIASR